MSQKQNKDEFQLSSDDDQNGSNDSDVSQINFGSSDDENESAKVNKNSNPKNQQAKEDLSDDLELEDIKQNQEPQENKKADKKDNNKAEFDVSSGEDDQNSQKGSEGSENTFDKKDKTYKVDDNKDLQDDSGDEFLDDLDNKDKDKDYKIGKKRKNQNDLLDQPQKHIKVKEQQLSEDEGYNEAQLQVSKLIQDFKQKTKSNTRRKNQDDDAGKYFENKVDRLLKRMKKAKEKDNQNILKGKAAIAKLCMIQEIKRSLSSFRFEDQFLQKGGLSQFEDWISKENGRYPSDQFLLNVIKIIDSMNIKVIHMENCFIGRVFMGIKRHPLKKQNKTLCRAVTNLINKWKRQIQGITSHYQDKRQSNDEAIEVKEKRKKNNQEAQEFQFDKQNEIGKKMLAIKRRKALKYSRY